MEIKSYAPVIIPTLCRYEHFKRCLESLERCTGAEYTDIYVGLDFPAKDKHVEGWRKIDEYLKHKEENNKFNTLTVIRRKENCGVGHENSNFQLLYKEISSKSDRYISTEDDNEFSPCFLDYMNKALHKYDSNDKVVFVNGYSPVEISNGQNVYFAHYGNAWGLGVWTRKKQEMTKLINLKFYKEFLSNFRKSILLLIKNPLTFHVMLNGVITSRYHGDEAMLSYCVIYDKLCLYPSMSMVRNWGNDGSGVHTKVTKMYDREISRAKLFELDEILTEESSQVRRELNRFQSKRWYGNLAILMRYCIWRLTGKDFFILLKNLGLIYKG